MCYEKGRKGGRKEGRERGRYGSRKSTRRKAGRWCWTWRGLPTASCNSWTAGQRRAHLRALHLSTTLFALDSWVLPSARAAYQPLNQSTCPSSAKSKHSIPRCPSVAYRAILPSMTGYKAPAKQDYATKPLLNLLDCRWTIIARRIGRIALVSSIACYSDAVLNANPPPLLQAWLKLI